MAPVAGTKGRSGRPVTTHDEIVAVARRLFEENGYAETSVTDIAREVGIARRTYFAYFASKADAFWWPHEQELRDVERTLAGSPVDGTHPLQQVIDVSLRIPSSRAPSKEFVRRRHFMIEQNPELHVGSQRLDRDWIALIAAHVRERINVADADLLPDILGAALLSVTQTLVQRWAFGDDERSLDQLFNENIATLRRVFEKAVTEDLLR